MLFFAGKTYNGAFRGQGPLEKSQEMHHYIYVLPQTKKYSSGLSKSEFLWYFYVPLRERERARARARARVRVRARKRKEKKKKKEKERKKEQSVGDYISKLPGSK